jgi:hypothetical protein
MLVDFTVQTVEDVGTMTVITAPWYKYVVLLGGVTLAGASGWQLRRSWRVGQ